MALNIGELVGYIRMDHSGVGTGMRAAERDVKTGQSRIAAESGRQGKEAGKRFGDGLRSNVKSAVDDVGRSWKQFGSGLLAGLAVGEVVDFFKGAVDGASQLEQSVGGVDAVFGQYAENVHAKSRQAAQDLGLSKNAYNELVTVSAAMLKNKGLDDFAQQSENLVKVGADLAAQFGGPTSQAVEALNAALRGESDPIERYGISLNEAAVNAKLAELGMTGLTGAALEQAKTQARLALITEQSADAQGAFAREADTAAGKQARLSAEWENQQAVLGEKLLPLMMAVTDLASGSLVPAFGSMVDGASSLASAAASIPGPVKAAVLALVAFHMLKGPLSSMLDTVRLKAMYAGDAIGGMAGKGAGGAVKAGLGGLMGMLGGPWGIAIAGATLAVGGFMQAQENARAAAEELTGTLDKQTGAFTDSTRSKFTEKIFGDFSEADFGRIRESLNDAGVGIADLIRAYEEGGPAVDRFKERFDAWQASAMASGNPQLVADAERIGNAYAATGRDMDAARVAFEEQKRVNDELAPSTEDVGDQADDAAPKVANLADSTDELKTKTEEAAGKQQELADAILAVDEAASDAYESESDYYDALDDTNERIAKRAELEKELKNANTPEERARIREELEKYKETLDLATEAGRENHKSLREQAEGAIAMAKANLNAGDGIDDVKEQMSLAREEFIKVAMQMNGGNKKAAEELATELGLTDEKVDTLSTSLGELPEETVVRLKAETAAADQAIKDLQTQIDLLKGKTVTITVKTGTIRATGQSSTGGPGRGFLEGSVRTGGPLRRFEGGGKINGPGTGTSDSVLAWVRETGNMIAVSNEEFVSTASSTLRNEAALAAGNRGATLAVAGAGGGMSAADLDAFEAMFARVLQKIQVAGYMDPDAAWSAMSHRRER